MTEETMEVESLTEEAELRRERMRTLAFAQRQQNRATVVNKNRVALGSPQEISFTAKFVTEKAKALKNKVLSIEEYRRLQDALIESEENINSFLKVDNILFALVRDLSGNNPALQLCAANCCCNLALGNIKACNSLTKSIAPYLIANLDSLNRPLLEVCIWTIGNLVAGSDKSFEVFHAQGCLKYLISLMGDCDSSILPSVSYTTMHYVHNGFKCITEDEVIELAHVTAKRNFSSMDYNFFWLLALLSSAAACNNHLRKILPRIVHYLHDDTRFDASAGTKVTASIIILANLVKESSGEVAHMILENPKLARLNLQALLNKYVIDDRIYVRKNTLWLIGNLYNHTSPSVREITKDILPQLSGLKQAIESCKYISDPDGVDHSNNIAA